MWMRRNTQRGNPCSGDGSAWDGTKKKVQGEPPPKPSIGGKRGKGVKKGDKKKAKPVASPGSQTMEKYALIPKQGTGREKKEKAGELESRDAGGERSRGGTGIRVMCSGNSLRESVKRTKSGKGKNP